MYCLAPLGCALKPLVKWWGLNQKLGPQLLGNFGGVNPWGMKPLAPKIVGPPLEFGPQPELGLDTNPLALCLGRKVAPKKMEIFFGGKKKFGKFGFGFGPENEKNLVFVKRNFFGEKKWKPLNGVVV